MFDADGRILLFNQRYVELMDRTGMPLQGRLLIDVLREVKAVGEWDGDPDEFFACVVADAKAGRTVTKTMARNGRSLRVVDQPMKGGGWVATFEDITEWQAAQEQISHMARHDALTNLPNRTLFREQLEKALRLVRRSDQLAVLCLDLDHFKDINDLLGHPVGDALLKEVARRLGECITEHDTVARLGGDEFAIVQFCSDCEPSAVAMLASHVVEKVSAPYEIAGHQLVIGVSIGISLAPEDGKNPDELLKKADLALYRAKEDGRGTYRFFETGMDARAQARRLLELDLRAALKRGEFEVYYQPIRDVAKDVVVAFEALVRWNHSLRGMISPVNFIPLAEETGLIVPLGEWVLRQACMDAAGWSQDVGVAVNLSPVQFKNPEPGIDREGGVEGLRPSGASARTGDHGIGAAAEQRGDAVGSARASRLWRQDLARRLRNGIFVAELPAQLPVRQDQDRPFVRERTGDARRFDGDRPRGDRPRQEPRHRHHGRRRRDRCAIRSLAPGGLHAGARLSVQPPASRRRGGEHADTAAAAPDRLGRPSRKRYCLGLAQREMRAAERHCRTEAQGCKARQHA